MQITLLIVEDFSLHCLANTLEPLRAANRLADRAVFEWTVATLDGGPARSSSGLDIAAKAPLRHCSGDLLIALPSYNARTAATPAMDAALIAAARRFHALAGFDMGPWLLAHAGLLDGCQATLHWDEIDAFAEAFPAVTVTRQRFLWHGNRLTCAGATAAFDAVTDLIERVAGPSLRLEVALLLIAPDVAVDPDSPVPVSGRAGQLLGLMQDTLESPLPVPDLARHMGLSARALDRLAQRSFGDSPAALYRRLRLLRARKLLRDTAMPVTEIALRVGYQDASAFSRAFTRAYGHAPRLLRDR